MQGFSVNTYTRTYVCTYSEISLICHNWECQFYGGLEDKVCTQYMHYSSFWKLVQISRVAGL